MYNKEKTVFTACTFGSKPRMKILVSHPCANRMFQNQQMRFARQTSRPRITQLFHVMLGSSVVSFVTCFFASRYLHQIKFDFANWCLQMAANVAPRRARSSSLVCTFVFAGRIAQRINNGVASVAPWGWHGTRLNYYISFCCRVAPGPMEKTAKPPSIKRFSEDVILLFCVLDAALRNIRTCFTAFDKRNNIFPLILSPAPLDNK
jgi:hypothetical protein